MVVLSAAIVASGKTLVARQFVEMTRLRIEGLMSAFTKLVDTGRDHTFIETENVRYVYQPMEALHLVLITNKASNILEDLETIRLLAKVVADCCQIQVNEEQVTKNAFDIVFAFDEVISFGHRESVTLSQIKTYTEMDSHEEKLHQMMEQSKINEAKEMAKKKQVELARQAASNKKDGTAMPGFGGGPGDDSSPLGAGTGPSQNEMRPGGGTGFDAPAPAIYDPTEGTTTAIRPSNAPKKGMALGKKKPGDIFGSMGMGEVAAPEAAEEQKPEAPQAAAFNPLLDPVRVEIEEKVTAQLQAEGGMDGDALCNGQFQVTVLDEKKAGLVCFKLEPQNQDFKYKVHPNLNKASHANNVLEVREASRAFRANQPAPLLKWQMKSSEDEFLPVTMSCWPSSTSDGTQIVLELELTDTTMPLEDIRIRFPAAPSSRPSISSAEPGEAVYDPGSQQVIWQISQLDKSESSGNFEFSASADVASLMPFAFEGVRRGSTRCPMNILECYHQANNEPIGYSCTKTTIYELRVGQ